MNGDSLVKVCFGCAHFDGHCEALQHLVTAQALHVEAHHLEERDESDFTEKTKRIYNVKVIFCFSQTRLIYGYIIKLTSYISQNDFQEPAEIGREHVDVDVEKTYDSCKERQETHPTFKM